ncbi:unnamed protein product [Closterium sp. Yama58-4]|nr:unnamed protein product [Closterium sp. Yama58-4]
MEKRYKGTGTSHLPSSHCLPLHPFRPHLAAYLEKRAVGMGMEKRLSSHLLTFLSIGFPLPPLALPPLPAYLEKRAVDMGMEKWCKRSGTSHLPSSRCLPLHPPLLFSPAAYLEKPYLEKRAVDMGMETLFLPSQSLTFSPIISPCLLPLSPMPAYLEKRAVDMGMEKLFLMTTRTADWFVHRGFVPFELERLPEEKLKKVDRSRGSKSFVKDLEDSGVQHTAGWSKSFVKDLEVSDKGDADSDDEWDDAGLPTDLPKYS